MEYGESKPITIASMLRAPRAGDTFFGWPHHVTLAPPFEVRGEGQLEQIKHAMDKLGDTIGPVPITGGQEVWLGDDNPVRVRLIKDAWAVETLHELVMRAVEENGGMPVDELHNYVHDQYKPHVTHKQDRGWLQENRTVELPGIDIVERDPRRNNLKTVLAHYAFTGWIRLD
jgi:2'-5' RNA ligase